jgi:hypothetical protein
MTIPPIRILIVKLIIAATAIKIRVALDQHQIITINIMERVKQKENTITSIITMKITSVGSKKRKRNLVSHQSLLIIHKVINHINKQSQPSPILNQLNDSLQRLRPELSNLRQEKEIAVTLHIILNQNLIVKMRLVTKMNSKKRPLSQHHFSLPPINQRRNLLLIMNSRDQI